MSPFWQWLQLLLGKSTAALVDVDCGLPSTHPKSMKQSAAAKAKEDLEELQKRRGWSDEKGQKP